MQALKPLYVQRKLLNGDEFQKWAKSQGFSETLSPDDFHVTVVYSKKPVDTSKFTPRNNIIKVKGGKRSVMPLGDEGAVVVKFESNILQDQWKQFCDKGCSWDYESYQPHITITYNGEKVDLNDVQAPTFDLKLGPEIFEDLDLDWKEKVEEK